MIINNMFKKKIEEKEILIMSHRGCWGGNIIENTRESVITAKKSHADIIEIDVSRSKDGVYYLFHDGNEKKLLNKKKHISEYTSEELESFDVYNSINTVSGYKLETLEEFLYWLPEDVLINLDRTWFFWNDESFFQLLEKSNKTNQIFLKSPVKKDLLQKLSETKMNISYIPIIKDLKDYEIVKQYDINLIGLELIITDESSSLINKKLFKEIKERNFLVVGNAEKLGEEYNLFLGYDDDDAILNNGKSWEKIIEFGINVIQTDWPHLLYNQIKV